MTSEATTADTKTGKKEKNEVDVAMQDGRIVTFAGKRQIIKSAQIGEDGTIKALFDFRNGDVRTLVFEPTDPIVYQLAGHGVLQKFGDEMAASGEKYSLEDKINWFDELAERMCDTSKTPEQRWFAETSSGGGVSGISVLVQAIMELRGLTAQEVKDKLNASVEKMGITKQALVAALRNSPEIKPTVERLEAERAAKAPKVDLEAALAVFE